MFVSVDPGIRNCAMLIWKGGIPLKGLLIDFTKGKKFIAKNWSLQRSKRYIKKFFENDIKIVDKELLLNAALVEGIIVERQMKLKMENIAKAIVDICFPKSTKVSFISASTYKKRLNLSSGQYSKNKSLAKETWLKACSSVPVSFYTFNVGKYDDLGDCYLLGVYKKLTLNKEED